MSPKQTSVFNAKATSVLDALKGAFTVLKSRARRRAGMAKQNTVCMRKNLYATRDVEMIHCGNPSAGHMKTD